ncbi:MAG TPA: RNA polymerase sigma factor [bacterium]|nr:RNA polymerase sigma factor [bacterium]
MNNDALIEAVINKKPGAFRKLVEQYQEKVINTCYRFLRNVQDAEDTAQEVFMEVHRSIENFRRESELSTWIYRIAVTRSLDLIRKQKRKKRWAPLLSLDAFNHSTDALPDPESEDPHQNLERRERSEILARAVAGLPANQRIAVTLTQYQGFSYAETAKIMDTTQAAVESLLHRAKQNLRKKLTRYFQRFGPVSGRQNID